jgi:hypothetical protein
MFCITILIKGFNDMTKDTSIITWKLEAGMPYHGVLKVLLHALLFVLLSFYDSQQALSQPSHDGLVHSPLWIPLFVIYDHGTIELNRLLFIGFFSCVCSALSARVYIYIYVS